MRLGKGSRGPLSEINVIPLVDIMLVLLIIFMITAPMMQYGLNVDVPKVTSKPLPSKEEPEILTITRGGRVILNEKEIPIGDLKQAVQLIFTSKQEKVIYVKADKDVPYGIVVSCLSLIREAGIERVNLVTKPAEER